MLLAGPQAHGLSATPCATLPHVAARLRPAGQLDAISASFIASCELAICFLPRAICHSAYGIETVTDAAMILIYLQGLQLGALIGFSARRCWLHEGCSRDDHPASDFSLSFSGLAGGWPSLTTTSTRRLQRETQARH
jgi:hypothetical protein